MVAPAPNALPFGPAGAFVALAVLVVLPAPLLWLWRRDALRRPYAVEEPPWFAFAMRVQWVTLASMLVSPAIAGSLQVDRALASFGARGIAAGTLVPMGALVLPWLAHLVMATIVSGDVEQRLRGADTGMRRRFALLGGSLGIVLPMITGLALFTVAIVSRQPRAAFAAFTGGFLVSVILATTRQNPLGLVPHAETFGPLRDRVFELASRAGVKLRQVYVLSAERVRLANAFAVHAGVVVLTDHLLARLSRREVEAVVAHELAHLRARHPEKLKWALLLGMALGAPCLLLPVGRFKISLAFAVMWLVFLAASRRFEYEADRGATELTKDPEALIGGLVQLCLIAHMPTSWGRGREWTLTHPSVRRRALALAAAGKLTAERAVSLVASPPDDAERWPFADFSNDRVFSTAAKTRSAAATYWLLLSAGVAGPALLIAGLASLGVRLPGVAWIALATLVAFGGALLVADQRANIGYARWERSLAARWPECRGWTFVGLAPAAEDMVYEGFGDWDIGFLALEPGVLRYRGELASFALAPDRIVSLELARGLPGWISSPRVAVSWRGADGAVRRFTLRDGRTRSGHAQRGSSNALLATLRDWQGAAVPAAAALPLTAEPPDGAGVTGTPISELAAPATLIPTAFRVLMFAGFATAVSGLAALPYFGPGLTEIFVGTMLAFVVLRIPAWRSRRGAPKSVPAEPLERAA